MVLRTTRIRSAYLAIPLFLLPFVLLRTASGAEPLPRLKVSEDRRFLTTADGRPFFWLGDTAWELFHRLNREEADEYLAIRASKVTP